MDDVDSLIAETRFPEALSLLTARSDAGDPVATHRLAVMIARGAAGLTNWPRTLELLTLAARQGSADAMAEIALLGGANGVAPDVKVLLSLPERQVLCDAPRVRRMDGFLTPAITHWLIEQARGRMTRAQTFNRTEGRDGALQDDPSRTNSAFIFGPFEGGVLLALIAARIGQATGVPPHQFEPTQIFHYEVGQAFRPHTDYFIDDGGSQRIATFLIYLNEELEGGETWFPRPALKVRPRTGTALYFANVDRFNAPDPLSLHAGLPPTSGEKWLLSQWVRDRPFVSD